MAAPSPSPVLRLAVILGAAALVAGTAGFVRLVIEGRAAPQPLLRLRLEGLPEGSRPDVLVHWHDEQGEVRQQARRGFEPGEWLLPPLPPGRDVTIVVQDLAVSPPRVLASEPLAAPLPPFVALHLGDGTATR